MADKENDAMPARSGKFRGYTGFHFSVSDWNLI